MLLPVACFCTTGSGAALVRATLLSLGCRDVVNAGGRHDLDDRFVKLTYR